MAGYGGALPCPPGVTSVAPFGTVGVPTTIAVCDRCAQGYYGSVDTSQPLKPVDKCLSCDALSHGTTSVEQSAKGLTTGADACQYCRGADATGPGYAMTAQAYPDPSGDDPPGPYPAQCELCTGGATAPLVSVTAGGVGLPGNRYSDAQCSHCVACNNGCLVCSNTCVSEECLAVSPVCVECEDGRYSDGEPITQLRGRDCTTLSLLSFPLTCTRHPNCSPCHHPNRQATG